MFTVLPVAKFVPSVVDTLIRSFDSSEWKVPVVPSAQEPMIVLGWLGSGPTPSRPVSSVPESHELPTVPHLGAFRTGSKTAVPPPPPPPRHRLRVVEPPSVTTAVPEAVAPALDAMTVYVPGGRLVENEPDAPVEP